MQVFDASTEVGVDELNSLHLADAVVDTSASGTTGSVFTTVAAAIAAGKKAIVVMPGTHAGFTITDPGISVSGIVQPDIYGATIPDGSAKFSSTITVSDHQCSLKWLAMNDVSGNGFLVNSCDNTIIDRCYTIGCTGTAIKFLGSHRNSSVNKCVIYYPENGVIIQPSATGHSIYHPSIVGCNIHYAQGSGIALLHHSTSDTADRRVVLVQGNLIDQCGDSWGNGITVEAYMGGTFIGNTILRSGSASNNDAHGMYFEVPAASRWYRSILTANTTLDNYGYGIAIAAATNKISITSHAAASNAAGSYSNCGSCPGFITGTYNTNMV